MAIHRGNTSGHDAVGTGGCSDGLAVVLKMPGLENVKLAGGKLTVLEARPVDTSVVAVSVVGNEVAAEEFSDIELIFDVVVVHIDELLK